MTEKADEDHLTKRLSVDPNQSASDFGTHTTDRELIDEELKAFKDDYPDGGPDVPWGNSIRLDEDDCILRQLNEQRVELYDAVYRRVGLSRSESASLVELVLTEITDSMARGETVKLSSFGTFTVRKKAKRMGRNPKTGIAAPIPPRRVVVFKASTVMKQRINANRLQEQSEKTLTETDMKGAALT